jgi:hypothetical protein
MSVAVSGESQQRRAVRGGDARIAPGIASPEARDLDEATSKEPELIAHRCQSRSFPKSHDHPNKKMRA